jgi:cob(I)alamin adenosyltransferase
VSLKIYTKTGDKGTTGLIGGTRISKAAIRIEAYGTVDELNSWLGTINSHFQFEGVNSLLKNIQDNLFTIGSALACDPEKDTKMYIPNFEMSSSLKYKKIPP